MEARSGDPMGSPSSKPQRERAAVGPWMLRILISVLLVFLFALNIQLWKWDGAGVRQVRALQVAVSKQRAENAVLEERNKALEAEVRSLKEDLEAIEERARTELGMIRKDEVFFHILEEDAEGGDSLAARGE